VGGLCGGSENADSAEATRVTTTLNDSQTHVHVGIHMCTARCSSDLQCIGRNNGWRVG
jgi:hypothetical protein